MRKIVLPLLTIAALFFASCKKDKDNVPKLRFKFVFDSTLPRLNNIGQPASIPSGNAAQTPQFNLLGAHFIELAPTAFTALGTGSVLYIGEETTQGGSKALVFDKQKLVANNGEFFTMPLKDVTPGTYEWLRVSLAYQNYDITYQALGSMWSGTIASFIGYNTYISKYKIKTQERTVNGNKAQGYWGFEVANFAQTYEGQAPAGATTVPNPLFATAPIPNGSCVVTGPFPTSNKLVISGNETKDITVVVKVSINQSFEWADPDGNGLFNPLDGDYVVDMGVRGIYPEVQ
ncbi:MAG: hypothetical protein KIS94_14880 [Chitinophagales bacterium]|nr:hypothetical protein [Chitinophagales bacterium]